MRRAACKRPRAWAGTTSKVDTDMEPSDRPLQIPVSASIAANCVKLSVKGISKNASAGNPVLGTVAHLRPTLSMIMPDGIIMTKTKAPAIENNNPTCDGEKFRCVPAYSGSMLCSVIR